MPFVRCNKSERFKICLVKLFLWMQTNKDLDDCELIDNVVFPSLVDELLFVARHHYLVQNGDFKVCMRSNI